MFPVMQYQGNTLSLDDAGNNFWTNSFMDKLNISSASVYIQLTLAPNPLL